MKQCRTDDPLDSLYFTRELALLLKSSVPLIESLDFILRAVKKPSLKKMIYSLIADLKTGVSFSNALQKHTRYFNSFYCHLIHVGEQSGTLAEILERIAHHLEKIAWIKSQLKRALLYPSIVLVVALIVSIILFVWVVPQFEQLFQSMSVSTMPLLTQYIFQLAHFFQRGGLFILIGLIGLIYFIYKQNQYKPKWRRRFEQGYLMCYVIGNIIKTFHLIHFTRTLSTTLTAGIPLLEGLALTSRIMPYEIYRRAIIWIAKEVATGVSLHEAMRKHAIFPATLVQMMTIAEVSGTLDTLLDKMATVYEHDLSSKIDKLQQLLEPCLMLILGLIMGSVIVAIYLPIFEMGQLLEY